MYTIPTPEELRSYRLRIGKTQTELAKNANVSQSLIARIERGGIDPRVSTLKKILQALKSEEKGQKVLAREIMRKKVITISKNDKLTNVSKIMEENNISQLPVVDNGVQVGSISEERVIHEFTQGKNINDVSDVMVKNIMGEGFPIVTMHTGIEVLSRLVEFNPCVLVADKDRLAGIITKSDVLRLLK